MIWTQRLSGATDSSVDGVDQDCDGVDGPDADGDGVADVQYGGEDCDDTDSRVQSFPDDADCDGYAVPIDCDDSDDTIYPMAGDVYGDGIDSDCDNADCHAETLQGIVTETIVLSGNLDTRIEYERTPLAGMPFDGMTVRLRDAQAKSDYSVSIEILDHNYSVQTLHVLFERKTAEEWGYHVVVDAQRIETEFESDLPAGFAFQISAGDVQLR